MKNADYKTYKWIEKVTRMISPITITQREIQVEAEGMLGRQLTEIEMNRVWYCLHETESVRDLQLEEIHSSIKHATDNTINSEGLDESYLEAKKQLNSIK